MSDRLRRTTVVLAALAAPILVGATASATAIHSQGKGKQVTAQFSVFDTLTCSDGTTAVMQTFVSVLSFETSVRVKGNVVAGVETDLDVNSFNPCTFVGSFDFDRFQVADLPMTDLNMASLLGHFVLPAGTVVDLNLTLTGTDTISQGHTSQRSTFARGMMILRSTGSQRTAAISGSVTINGRVITSSQMSQPDAMLFRTSGSDMTIINP